MVSCMKALAPWAPLGSGGARGWDTLGRLRALEEHEIQDDCISGASIAALVSAAIIALVKDDMKDFLRDLSLERHAV